MRRRDFMALLGGAAWPLAARAQQTHGMRRISVVNVITATDPDASPRIAAFEVGLRELGWATDRNLRIDYYWNASDAARRGTVAKQAAETKPDVVVTATTPVTEALRDELNAVPIVFIQVIDPVGTGLVAGLARPGGNITGFTNFEFSMGGKWLEVLKEITPRLKTVALLFNPATAPGAGKLLWGAVEAAAVSFAVKSIAASVRQAEDIHDVLARLARDQDAGLIIHPDIFTTRNRDLIISLAARHRVPAVYPFRYFVTEGGLVSYGIDAPDLFRRAASYVDRILRGAKPADLPVQQPTKFELVINLKTAKALGLEVPPMLLTRTDEVIE
jgi:putative tryptophan/tyrosine transport system substrate-binding protein